MRVPILVGSNANEATVFGHNGLNTVDDYKKHLQQDTGQYSNEEFQLYPVSSDAEVPSRSIQLESDEFACGAYSLTQAITRVGVRSYLYDFTYVDPGKRARLGAHHGEELFFLTNSFPDDWEHTGEDENLGDLVRSYWAEFVKTSDPNFDGAPKWPSYDSASTEYFEIGAHVGLRPVSERIRNLETTMRRIVTGQGRD